MSLIPCTDQCIYQEDGYCSLSRAVSCSVMGHAAGCVNFVPRSKNGAKRLTDIIHPDQLQPFRDH